MNTEVLYYDRAEFPLIESVMWLLGVDDLTSLTGPSELKKRENDQESPYHDAFYAGFEKIRHLYTRFVHHVVAGHVEAPYCYQAVPTFRVQFPENVAVGEFHKDGDYNHPDGEINFWVPLTPVSRRSAVWIEPSPNAFPEPVPVQPGEVLVFDAVNTKHGNVVNSTSQTRVSFDFRCLPMSRHTDTEAASLNTNLRFVVGGYYLTDDESLKLPE